MRTTRTDERGASTVELGLLLPIMLLLAAMALPVLHVGVAHLVLNRAAAAGIRYATRADTNARMPAPECPSRTALTRRPTACEVENYVRDSSGAFAPSAVTTTIGGDPGSANGVPGDPADAVAGEIVSVTVSYEVSLGPAPAIVNGLRGITTEWFNGSGAPELPSAAVITVSSWGRME